jgi:adenylylsulfate kinase-like enzyme
MTRSGGVVWVTGLAGAGKTTVATAVCDRLRAAGEHPVLLDGDALRAMLPTPLGYTLSDRRRLAMFYAQLAGELAAQGHQVVCATVSLFHQVHEWNRCNIEHYLEVWLRVPVDTLRDRGARAELYGEENGADQVVGVDAAAEFPIRPDLVIDNHGHASAIEAAETIVEALDTGLDRFHVSRYG